MDTKWLESLLALIENGSFTRAAEAQHLSQPAFSRRIRSLEQWFGAELVDRTTFPATLTPNGKRIWSYAGEVVAGLAQARDEIRGRELMPRNSVRVSVSHTLAVYYFSDWWVQVSGGNGGVPLQLMPSNTLDGYDALLHGGCDLLLAYADPAHPLGIDHSGLEWVVVATERVAPYSMAREGRAAFGLPGSANRLAPFVTHGSSAFLGRVTHRLVTPLRLYLRPVAQSDLTSALAGLIRVGMGVGWLPALAADEAVRAGTIVQIGDPGMAASLEIRLYRRRGQCLDKPAAQVWERARATNVVGTAGRTIR